MFDFNGLSNVKTYDQNATALRFLLGGIATGNISLDAKGTLCDFEIFNRQAKGFKIPYSFFSFWYKLNSGESKALVLETKHEGFLDSPMGVAPGLVPGLPRFDRSTFKSAYPFAQVDLEKDGCPFEVTLQAFTPFIPLNEKDSGIPGIRFTYRIKNISGEKADVSIAATMSNPCGIDTYSHDGLSKMYLKAEPHNTVVDNGALKGLSFSTELGENELGYGTMMLLAQADEGFSAKSKWLNEGWWDGPEDFWHDFTDDGVIGEPEAGLRPISRVNPTSEVRAIGSIAVKKSIEPGEYEDFAFYITWNFPNRYGWWPDGYDAMKPDFCDRIFKTYYSTLWKNAQEVAEYLHGNIESLEKMSAEFAKALFSSTVDKDLLDAVASNITVLRSPTCFRIADGTFYGWEGCFFEAGSCPGSCTHVWNYAQTLANLFPSLERNMRRTEFLQETEEDGRMNFRAKKHLEGAPWDMYPAVDGQLGCVLRVYREWVMSGDDDFLKELWPNLVKVLEYSRKTWDSDGDSVLDGEQHNTYDIEFYGINSLGNAIFFAALKAGARMAAYLGENDLAKEWEDSAAAGAEKMDKLLYNGEYYIQAIEDVDAYKYQYGEGCLSDQLLGQTLAHLYGLGYVLPEAHVKSAVASIYKYNFRENMADHYSVQRGYAHQDDAGTLLCSWPKGGRPYQPFVYSDEVWTGIEYHVATHLIYEGLLDEGLSMVRAVRNRYDGYKRSPFNEIECGNHYARSMASWGLLKAISGLRVDLPAGKLSIDPKVNGDDFRCFYATGKEWGVCRQYRDEEGNVKQVFEPVYKA